jgi:hypothetical protein
MKEGRAAAAIGHLLAEVASDNIVIEGQVAWTSTSQS